MLVNAGYLLIVAGVSFYIGGVSVYYWLEAEIRDLRLKLEVWQDGVDLNGM